MLTSLNSDWYDQYWYDSGNDRPPGVSRLSPVAASPSQRTGLSGLAVIVGCLEAGIAIQGGLNAPIPGSVLGMLLLLLLLGTGVVRQELVVRASGWLLSLLPALFVPLYVLCFADPQFWAGHGAAFLPAAAVAAAVTLMAIGGLAIWGARR